MFWGMEGFACFGKLPNSDSTRFIFGSSNMVLAHEISVQMYIW